jgi:hypothetical protein
MLKSSDHLKEATTKAVQVYKEQMADEESQLIELIFAELLRQDNNSCS